MRVATRHFHTKETLLGIEVKKSGAWGTVLYRTSYVGLKERLLKEKRKDEKNRGISSE
jgi:hypothetical protein